MGLCAYVMLWLLDQTASWAFVNQAEGVLSEITQQDLQNKKRFKKRREIHSYLRITVI